ncbi:MAG: S1 family peptidase [Acidimicrobiia bacterium]
MRTRLLVLLGALTMALTFALPAGAITNGEPTTDHPEVVLIIADVDGGPAFRCSGTMLDATHVLTAGHCTSNFPDPGVITGMRVFTEADVENGDNNYPFSGNNTVEAVSWAAHPDYETGPFFLNDVGMIKLQAPGVVLDAADYGTLPAVDSLDAYKTNRGKNKLTFDSVGYGLQRINPVFVEAEKVRHIAHPKLNQINVPGFTGDFSLLLSNNHSTGGTCFGDSGGPNFIQDTTVVAGITSFGINGNCAGTGGVFRTDRQSVQDFIYSFWTPYPEGR